MGLEIIQDNQTFHQSSIYPQLWQLPLYSIQIKRNLTVTLLTSVSFMALSFSLKCNLMHIRVDWSNIKLQDTHWRKPCQTPQQWKCPWTDWPGACGLTYPLHLSAGAKLDWLPLTQPPLTTFPLLPFGRYNRASGHWQVQPLGRHQVNLISKIKITQITWESCER